MQTSSLMNIELELDDFIPKGDTRHYMGVDLVGLQMDLRKQAGPFYDPELTLMQNVEELLGTEFHDAVQSALLRHKNNLKTAYAIIEKVLESPN